MDTPVGEDQGVEARRRQPVICQPSNQFCYFYATTSMYRPLPLHFATFGTTSTAVINCACSRRDENTLPDILLAVHIALGLRRGEICWPSKFLELGSKATSEEAFASSRGHLWDRERCEFHDATRVRGGSVSEKDAIYIGRKIQKRTPDLFRTTFYASYFTYGLIECLEDRPV